MKHNILRNSLGKYYLPNGNASLRHYSFTKSSRTHLSNISILNAQRTAMKMITHFFSPIQALSSKPVITMTRDKVIINVFYFIPGNHYGLNNNTVNNLGNLLSGIFGLPVELRFVKLHYPYLNSYILAQFIAMNVEKYNFNQIQRMIFNPIIKDYDSQQVSHSHLPSQIVGMKVRISGRLVTESIRPRQTVSTYQMGSFSQSNKSRIDYAKFTNKNSIGAFTVKVWISQVAA